MYLIHKRAFMSCSKKPFRKPKIQLDVTVSWRISIVYTGWMFFIFSSTLFWYCWIDVWGLDSQQRALAVEICNLLWRDKILECELSDLLAKLLQHKDVPIFDQTREICNSYCLLSTFSDINEETVSFHWGCTGDNIASEIA